MSNNKDKTYFQDSCLENDEFKQWLVKANEKTQAKCKHCHKTFELSNMGIQALSLEVMPQGKSTRTFRRNFLSFILEFKG